MATHAKPSEATRRVSVGSVPLGGGAPVVVQSMLNAPATDVAANLAQIDALAQAGCEIVRMAIPHRSSLDVFQAVCERSPLPVVADIHFDANIAIEAAKRGAAKLRINPGNIGGLAKTDAVLDAAGEAGIPIRIGVNAGGRTTTNAREGAGGKTSERVARADAPSNHPNRTGGRVQRKPPESPKFASYAHLRHPGTTVSGAVERFRSRKRQVRSFL